GARARRRASGCAKKAKSGLAGVWVITPREEGPVFAATGGLRRRFGAALRPILIPADRSPYVREDARASAIQLLHKPIKPAALRALLTQWRMQRVAAAE